MINCHFYNQTNEKPALGSKKDTNRMLNLIYGCGSLG